MTRSHRKRHFAISVSLALTLPTLFGAALAVRRPVPPVAEIPETIDFAGTSPRLLESRRDLEFKELGFAGALGCESGDNPRPVAELRAIGRPGIPELLVYWSNGDLADGRLPHDAILLGRFGDGRTVRYPLPTSASPHRGTLILYSVADYRVVSAATPAGRTTP